MRRDAVRSFVGVSARDVRKLSLSAGTVTGVMCTAARSVLCRVDVRNAGCIVGDIDKVMQGEKITGMEKEPGGVV